LNERLKQFTLNDILLKWMKACEIIANDNLKVQLQYCVEISINSTKSRSIVEIMTANSATTAQFLGAVAS